MQRSLRSLRTLETIWTPVQFRCSWRKTWLTVPSHLATTSQTLAWHAQHLDGRLQISMIASADGEAVLGKEGRQRRWWKGSRSKNCELNCSRPLMPIRCWFDAFIHWNSAAEGPSKEAPDSICWGSRPYKGNVLKKDQKVNPPYQCSFEAIDV